MKNVDALVESAKNYRNGKLYADHHFRTEVQKLSHYNEQIRKEKTFLLDQETREEVARLRGLYEDTKRASLTIIEDAIEAKFTGTLTPQDVALFDNMDRIEFSQDELNLLIKKYHDNPMALKRIKRRSEELGLETIAFRDYSYYIEQLKDFGSMVDRLPDYVDGLDKAKEVDDTMAIVLQVETTAAESAGAAFNEVLSELGL